MSIILECEKWVRKLGVTIATAESCTGGLVASEMVSVPHSSDWFLEGCVTYIPEAKITRLGVNPESIVKDGVVSGVVACEMAKGVRCNLGADWGLSTTGYAGPGGGDSENPVGTVYVAVSNELGERSIRLSLSGDRNEIRLQAMQRAIEFLISEMKKQDSK